MKSETKATKRKEEKRKEETEAVERFGGYTVHKPSAEVLAQWSQCRVWDGDTKMLPLRLHVLFPFIDAQKRPYEFTLKDPSSQRYTCNLNKKTDDRYLILQPEKTSEEGYPDLYAWKLLLSQGDGVTANHFVLAVKWTHPQVLIPGGMYPGYTGAQKEFTSEEGAWRFRFPTIPSQKITNDTKTSFSVLADETNIS